MKKRVYTSLQEWMEATSTNRRQLAHMSRIDETHLSKILTGSRRCSIEKALRLHEATGVPVDNLVKWFARDLPSRVEQAVKAGGRKCA